MREDLYCKRWGITKGNSKSLNFCNEHMEEVENVPIEYKSRSGKKMVQEAKLVLPIKPGLDAVRTLNEFLQRAPYV